MACFAALVYGRLASLMKIFAPLFLFACLSSSSLAASAASAVIAADTPSEAVVTMVELRQEAEDGSVTAMLNLGTLFAKGGEDGTPDWDAAQLWWSKAADEGDTQAMLNLGLMHAKGSLGRVNHDKALIHFEQALVAGEPKAMDYIKKLPLSTSFGWWEQHSKTGDASAACFLGACYEEGQGVVKDLDVAARYYGMAADKGDATALAKMSELPTIYTKLWWERRSDEGNVADKRALADSYAKGTGSSPDWETAARYYGEAADAGDAPSLEQMKTLPLQYTAEWWEKKALAGDADAAFFVAEGYAAGRGTRVDMTLANRYYSIAAEEGHPTAAAKLQALPLVDTADWWDERAMKGDLEASQYLMKAYGTGQMGPIKVMMASKYVILAATQGNKDCLYALVGFMALFVLLFAIPFTRGLAFGVTALLGVWFALMLVIP